MCKFLKEIKIVLKRRPLKIKDQKRIKKKRRKLCLIYLGFFMINKT